MNYTVLTNSIADGILLLSPLFLIYSLTFFCFFKSLLTNDQKAVFSDKISFYNSNSPLFYTCYLYVLNVTIFFFIMFLLFCKNTTISIWSDHLILTNNNLLFITFIFSFIVFLLLIFNNLHTQGVNLYKDYFFSLTNILLSTPYIFLVNNFFSFIFILEYINTVVFYKLISSKLEKNKNYFVENTHEENNLSSKKYVNIIFFQFWATFFSNMFFFYFFIYMLFKVGSTNWNFLNFVFQHHYIFLDFELVQIALVSITFILSVFLKLGSAPLHLFKVEIYEGLPYVSIFFYTTFYVSVFFLFLIYFFSYLTLSLYVSLVPVFIYFVLFGLAYIVFNSIFNIQTLKSFFAYSTILNISLFFVVFTLTIL